MTALQLAAPLLDQDLQRRMLASWHGQVFEAFLAPPSKDNRYYVNQSQRLEVCLARLRSTHMRLMRQERFCPRYIMQRNDT